MAIMALYADGRVHCSSTCTCTCRRSSPFLIVQAGAGCSRQYSQSPLSQIKNIQYSKSKDHQVQVHTPLPISPTSNPIIKRKPQETYCPACPASLSLSIHSAISLAAVSLSGFHHSNATKSCHASRITPTTTFSSPTSLRILLANSKFIS